MKEWKDVGAAEIKEIVTCSFSLFMLNFPSVLGHYCSNTLHNRINSDSIHLCPLPQILIIWFRYRSLSYGWKLTSKNYIQNLTKKFFAWGTIAINHTIQIKSSKHSWLLKSTSLEFPCFTLCCCHSVITIIFKSVRRRKDKGTVVWAKEASGTHCCST